LARRSFDVADVTEILIHRQAGRSQSHIASSLGVDRKTTKKYLDPAVAAWQAGAVTGGVGRAGVGVVSAAQQHQAASDHLAGDRGAPRFHRGDTEGRGDPADDLAAAARRAWGLTASTSSLKRYVDANLPEATSVERCELVGPLSCT
jgi:hypothetical protein